MSMSPLFRTARREPAAPVAPAAVPATSQTKPSPSAVASLEQLSEDDARALSPETLSLLAKENPTLVARLAIDAGKRARGELPMAPLSSLHPTARAATLAGEKARGLTLDEEEAAFLAAYVAEHWPS